MTSGSIWRPSCLKCKNVHWGIRECDLFGMAMCVPVPGAFTSSPVRCLLFVAVGSKAIRNQWHSTL